MPDHDTGLYGVWGHPIKHSFSPLIHNPAFSKFGINAIYTAFDIHPDELEQAVRGARSLGLAGWNLTVPHKQAILPLLDEISDTANRIGAVNTVVNDNGRLVGDNTDADGFLSPLLARTQFQPTAAECLLIGAGGAARAVAFALADAGAGRITIANRTAETAQDLVAELRSETSLPSATACTLEAVAGTRYPSVQLVVQCTSLGLSGHLPPCPDWESLPRDAVITDLVYGPQPTPFLQAASAHGLATHDGIWMLLGQASQAFYIWTGHHFDLDEASGWIADAIKQRQQ